MTCESKVSYTEEFHCLNTGKQCSLNFIESAYFILDCTLAQSSLNNAAFYRNIEKCLKIQKKLQKCLSSNTNYEQTNIKSRLVQGCKSPNAAYMGSATVLTENV